MQVAINSCLQVVLFSPMALFYLNVVSRGSGISLAFWPIARSVLIFLGVPLLGGLLTRYLIIFTMGRRWLDTKFMPYFGPMALVGLLYTIFIMFSSQVRCTGLLLA
jgi:arsenite transporter